MLIEDNGSGTSLLQDLRADGSFHATAIKPEGDKMLRASRESAKIKDGTILLPASAPWLDAFQCEVLQFPEGRHDDQIDSMTQYLGWSRPRSTTDFCKPIIIEFESASPPWELG